MHSSSPFRRRLLTVAAIVMMVSSALLSFFLVQENDRRIAELKRGEERTEQAIRTLWGDAAQADRNADAAVIVSLLARESTPEALEFKRYYLMRVGKPAGTALDALKAADEGRKHAVDAVNDLYISQVDIQNDIMAREADNRRYADFAFLLQLISLVLVILTREMPGV